MTKVTTSCTVARSFSWSSGISTPNLSCAATAISTMASESMSRPSTKLFAGGTSAAGTPAISSTISPRPSRISCSVMSTPLLVLVMGGSGYRDDLRRVTQPRAVSGQQDLRPGYELPALGHPGQCERDRRRRRVSSVHDVVGHLLPGDAELTSDRLDDAQVRLVRHERGQLVNLHAGPLAGLPRDRVDRRGRPAEHRLPVLMQERRAVRDGDLLHEVAGAAPDYRADAGLVVARPDHRRASAVGEDDAGRPVGPVHPGGHLLRADHHHVPRGSAADGGGGDFECVAEAGAGRVEVERAGAHDAEAMCHRGGGVRDRHLGTAGGHDHQVDVGGGQAAAGQRLAAGLDRHVLDGLRRPGDTAALDPDPGADPLVVRVYARGQVMVGHHVVGLVAAEREDAGARHHVWDPHACSSMSRRAASIWSGVFSARSSTPGIARLARPVSVPAGGSSMMAVTPSSRMVAMHASQRTGAATWATMRPSHSLPVVTAAPSVLDSSVISGSRGSISRAAERSVSTARAMWLVWNAPATFSGISRAPGGGSAAKAASSASVPAATSWPAPLMFAGVRPCLAIASSTVCWSSPRRAVIAVG